MKRILMLISNSTGISLISLKEMKLNEVIILFNSEMKRINPDFDKVEDITINDLILVENVLNITIELLELDYNNTVNCFVEYFNLNVDDIKNKNKTYVFILFSVSYLSVFNNIYNKKSLQTLLQTYIQIKINIDSKKFTTVPILELLAKFKKGKEEKIYKTLKSFNKVLEEHYVHPDDFKYIKSVLGGLIRGFDRKIGIGLDTSS